MKIIYKKDYGEIYDFLTSLWIIVNKDILEENLKESEIDLDKDVFNLDRDIFNVLSKLEKKNGIKKESLYFFFSQYNRNTETFNTIAHGLLGSYGNIDNIEVLLNDLQGSNEVYLVEKVFKSIIGGGTIELNTLKKVLKSQEDKIGFIESIQCTPEQKWNLILFANEPKKYVLEFCEIIRKYIKVYEKNLEKMNKIKVKYNDEFEKNLRENGLDYLKSINDIINYEKFDEIIVYPLFVNFFSFVYNLIGEKLEIGIGFKHKEFIDKIRDKNSNYKNYDAILKILGDKSKLNIIKLLNKSEMYGTEIAEKLNLTTATVSHHMSQLSVVGLVTLDRSDTKVYYKLNKKRLKEVVLYLKSEFNLSDC
ncbi:ArsR/SmtB family transcription factor [Clostridium senegalense]